MKLYFWPYFGERNPHRELKKNKQQKKFKHKEPFIVIQILKINFFVIEEHINSTILL